MIDDIQIEYLGGHIEEFKQLLKATLDGPGETGLYTMKFQRLDHVSINKLI